MRLAHASVGAPEGKDCLLTQQRRQQAPRHGRHHLLAGRDVGNAIASISARHDNLVPVYPVVVLAV